MSISLRTNLKSKFICFQIWCNKKSRRIGSKLGKFLNNLVGSKQHVIEEKSFINVGEDDDVFFTPTSSMDHLDTEQFQSCPTYVCEICVESNPLDISFNIKGCSHFYCIDCTVKYIESKLDDNVTRIVCLVANCDGVLDPDFCREILPRGLFNRWGKALCESAFLESEKVYCPYKDCSNLLINDGKKGIKKFKCPFCKRLFCVQCKVAWHSGLDCKKFQKLKPLGSDASFVDLAKRKKWKQCPNCTIYVGPHFGCGYIKCGCGVAFCYYCVANNATRDHYCYKCQR